MVLLSHAETMHVDNVTFYHWTEESPTQRFLRVWIAQCFCKVMAMLWHSEQTGVENARFHPRGTDIATSAVKVRCSDLAGEEKLRLKAHRSDLALNLQKYIACKLSVNLQSLQLIGPDGQLLASLCRANPKAKIGEVTRSIFTPSG